MLTSTSYDQVTSTTMTKIIIMFTLYFYKQNKYERNRKKKITHVTAQITINVDI